MTGSQIRVTIPFRPLLHQIAEKMNYHEPIYQLLDKPRGGVSLTITPRVPGLIEYAYIGDPGVTVNHSCEQAAQRAVRDMIDKFVVVVEDITSAMRADLALCGSYYRAKRLVLEKYDTTGLVSKDCKGDRDVLSPATARVDYMSVLRAIFAQSNILASPVETVEQEPGSFTSWIIMSGPDAVRPGACLFGEKSPDLVTAEASLAKKAIAYLIPLHNIELIDANYDPLLVDRYAAVACALERETYMTVKERVLGIPDVVMSSSLLPEDVCAAPRTLLLQMPTITLPPLHPKKRNAPAEKASSSTVRNPSPSVAFPSAFMALPPLDMATNRPNEGPM